MNETESKKVNQQYADKASTMTEKDLDNVMKKEKKVFSLFSKLGEKAGDLGLLWNLLRDYKSGKYKEVPWKFIAATVFAFVYLCSPFDVIPDFIPVLGFTDDVSVFGLVIAGFASDVEKYRAWRNENALSTAENTIKEVN